MSLFTQGRQRPFRLQENNRLHRCPAFKISICCLLHIGECQIRHKLVRPYTPRHNGKAGRSHREDQKRFYSCHAFYSLDDFKKQLSVHSRRPNNLPMRPLRRLSPIEFAVQYV